VREGLGDEVVKLEEEVEVEESEARIMIYSTL